MTIAALVPARNEADRIQATVASLLSVDGLDEIIVIDDGSIDATAALAAGAGARVIRSTSNRGKGVALRAGLEATMADVVVLIDADLGSTAAVAGRLLAPITAGEADMTIARPPDGAPSGFGLVERLSRWGIQRLCGATMQRPLSGQRAVRRDILDRFGFAPRFGVETALTIDAVRAGFRVIEVPYPIEHAKTGRDMAGFAHRARQGIDVAAVLMARSVGRERQTRGRPQP